MVSDSGINQSIRCEKIVKVYSYLWPTSWAMVKAVERPVSSLTVQLRTRLHIPSIGANPGVNDYLGKMKGYKFNDSETLSIL